MTVGEKSIFAIESYFARAFENLSFRALGCFILHIGGESYGVREPEATMLASAFDEAGRLIVNRGNHTAPFAAEANASDIVDAIRAAIHGPTLRNKVFFGLPTDKFKDCIYSSHCSWHWACDEAFDDGSGVWHFDVGDRVRLIAERFSKENHASETMRDVWLKADTFYTTVCEWHQKFALEWTAATKE